MAYGINRKVTKEDQRRALLPEVAYVARLRRDGKALEVGNILVDVKELVERRFVCDTRHCLRFSKKGRARGSCCTDLEVNITPNETRRLRRLCRRFLDSAAASPDAPETAIARRVIENGAWMEDNYRGEPTLEHDKKKVCALGFLDNEGRLLCALNRMAAALGEPLAKWKLDTCYCFPLHYVEYEDGRYLLTVISEDNYESLDASEEVGKLRCLRRPPDGAPPAYRFLRGEIEWLLGPRFYERLCQAIEREGLGVGD